MSDNQKGLEAEILIEKLVHRGAGLGRIDGQVCLVPFTVPGDLVKVQVTKRRSGMVEAEVAKIIGLGPGRTHPKCEVFGRCGGCQWQHIAYDRQPEFKAEVLLDTFRRIAGLELPKPQVISGDAWQWRARIELHASRQGLLGFYAAGSHDIVEHDSCPIAWPELSELITPIRRLVAKFPPPDKATIELVAGADRKVVAVIRGYKTPEIAKKLSRVPGISGVHAQVAGPGWVSFGQKLVRWDVPGPDGTIPMQLDPRGFSQANPGLNAQLVSTVVLATDPDDKVLELYAGAGNITVPLVMQKNQVVAVEVNRQALLACQSFLQPRGKTAEFIPGKVDTVVKTLIGRHFDLLIADPPRTGLGPVTEQIVRLAPTKIVLVSCEPSTLARDLKVLTNAGYIIDSTTVIDMFPQTWHIESIVLLSKRASRLLSSKTNVSVPKAKTLGALAEVAAMKKSPHKSRGYTDVDQMMKELLE